MVSKFAGNFKTGCPHCSLTILLHVNDRWNRVSTIETGCPKDTHTSGLLANTMAQTYFWSGSQKMRPRPGFSGMPRRSLPLLPWSWSWCSTALVLLVLVQDCVCMFLMHDSSLHDAWGHYHYTNRYHTLSWETCWYASAAHSFGKQIKWLFISVHTKNVGPGSSSNWRMCSGFPHFQGEIQQVSHNSVLGVDDITIIL